MSAAGVDGDVTFMQLGVHAYSGIRAAFKPLEVYPYTYRFFFSKLAKGLGWQLDGRALV